MEVEPVPYIFGSFNRRRSSHANSQTVPSTTVFNNKNLSNQQTTTNKRQQLVEKECTRLRGKHMHSKSQPETGNIGPNNPNSNQNDNRALRTRSCNLNLKPRSENPALSATCPICNNVFLEPRVLECLHSFCTHCLQDTLEKNREIWLPKDDQPSNKNILSILTSPNVDVNFITCPVCSERTPLHRNGIIGLPPDYIIQHRLVLATLNDENTKLLCDFCSGDSVAIERCSDCLVNLCALCAAVHRRQPLSADHEILNLREVRRRGLMKIHRQLMCQSHPEHELVVYCNTCQQPACPLCVTLHHPPSSHRCSPCPPVAAAHSQRLRRLLGRARGAAARDQALRRRLTAVRRAVDHRCQTVHQQVEQHMEEYRRIVEQHRKKLIGEIETIKTSLLSFLSTFESSLSARIHQSTTAINFTQTLLEEGSDIELLTFVTKIFKKLEDLEQPIKIVEELKELLKQTNKDRNSEHDGLVDFLPQNTTTDFEYKKSSRNFDAFQRPLKHVLVDFVPNKDENNLERKNYDVLKEHKSFKDRKSLSSNESGRNSRNLHNIKEEVVNNKCNITTNEKENKTNSLKRRSNNSLERKLEDINLNKPNTSILSQLRNCLENFDDKNTESTNKSSIIEETCVQNSFSNFENYPTATNSVESLSQSDLTLEESGILQFLPLEPEIRIDGPIPVIFGQIKRLTSHSIDGGNCCSASRPHLGRSSKQKSKLCCGQVPDTKETNVSNKKNSVNGKLYQITI